MAGLRFTDIASRLTMLLPPLQAALRTLGDAPARSLSELAVRLSVSEAEAEALVAPPQEQVRTLDQAAEDSAAASACPLFATMAPNDGSCAPKTRLNRRSLLAARKSIIA